MQTGNTVFLGLGSPTGNSILRQPEWIKSVVSIAGFSMGAFGFSRLHRLCEPLRRSTLVFSFLLQTILVFLTASFIRENAANDSTLALDSHREQVLFLLMMSFQAAGQLVASRALCLGEIPSVVVTSVLCDMVSDPQLVVGWSSNVKRNRRVLAFLGILIGAAVGGLATRKMTIEGLLRVVGSLKLLVTMAWIAWPAQVKV